MAKKSSKVLTEEPITSPISEERTDIVEEPKTETFVKIVAKTNFETKEGFWVRGICKEVSASRADELRRKYPNIF